jgi:predicted nucleic acid-binding protein
MIFDTDVLIWCFRGDLKATRKIDSTSLKQISVVTLMELFQRTRNQSEQRQIRSFLSQSSFTVLPLTDEIGHRASILVESHALAGGLQIADALIAATALEYGATLCTGNAKHYRIVKELDVSVFRPSRS